MTLSLYVLVFLLVPACCALGFAVYILKREIGKQKEKIDSLEQQWIRNSKFSVLGEMAGNFAHEVNTPLSVIALRTEQLLTELGHEETAIDRERWKKLLTAIDATAKRMTHSVASLRSFVRDSREEQPVECGVSSLVGHAVDLSREKFKYKGIEVDYAESSELLMVCHPAEVTQGLLYVLLNAAENASGPGKIQVRAVDFGEHFELNFTGALAENAELGVALAIFKRYGGHVIFTPSKIHLRLSKNVMAPAAGSRAA